MDGSTNMIIEDSLAMATEARLPSRSCGQPNGPTQTQEPRSLGYFIAIGEYMWGLGQTPAEALDKARRISHATADDVFDASAPYWHILLVPRDSWVDGLGTLRWLEDEVRPRLIDVRDVTGQSLPLSRAVCWLNFLPSEAAGADKDGAGS